MRPLDVGDLSDDDAELKPVPRTLSIYCSGSRSFEITGPELNMYSAIITEDLRPRLYMAGRAGGRQ